MIVLKEDPRNTCAVNRRCTHGDKGPLQVLAIGEILLHVNVQDKGSHLKTLDPWSTLPAVAHWDYSG